MLSKTLLASASFFSFASLAFASPIAFSNGTDQSYRLSIKSNEDSTLDGEFVVVTPVTENADIYTVTVGKQQERSPFFLNGSMLTTKQSHDVLYAQFDNPVDTYHALTFSNQYEGQQMFYTVEQGKLKYDGELESEWFACGDKKLISLYPLDAPQQGCVGINITAEMSNN